MVYTTYMHDPVNLTVTIAKQLLLSCVSIEFNSYVLTYYSAFTALTLPTASCTQCACRLVGLSGGRHAGCLCN